LKVAVVAFGPPTDVVTLICSNLPVSETIPASTAPGNYLFAVNGKRWVHHRHEDRGNHRDIASVIGGLADGVGSPHRATEAGAIRSFAFPPKIGRFCRKNYDS
jgi:hypothetical protein